ncbi:MAG: hypothetical protein WA265_05075, partial [Rhodomicrobium sp.]
MESTFGGENARNSRVFAKMAINCRRVYHSGFNHEMAVQKQAPGAAKVGWELRNEHSGASATSRRK